MGFTITAICAAMAALALAPAARADGSPPTGRVESGFHSPVLGSLDLVVSGHATDGATLGNAAILLNGAPAAGSALCPAAQPCTDTAGAGVPLSLDTTRYADGLYHLTVTVADSNGASSTVYDFPNFEIWNHRPTGSSSATLIIGSGVPAPPPQVNPGGGVLGASAGSCVKPKLSMRLSQKPLRIRKGVPVLVKGKRYRFTGRLTCLVDKKRVSAPKRTRIELRQIVHGKSHLKGRGTVGSHGKLVVRFSVPSSRTLEFRFTTADKKVSRVRIKVRVVKVAAHKKHHKRHEKG